MLTIYNTLTRKKEIFKPLHPGIVNMYVCGPTVYNYIHIGNARSAIAFDTVRRYLEFKGYQVNYVSNFTDVDDKMIKAAHEQGITVPQLADKYIKAFMEDTTAINIEPATSHPRATEHIPEIINFVQRLIDKGYAYAKDGDVYYRARKFAHYGELSGQSIDDLEVGASEHVSADEVNKKEDPMDFALWKAAKPGEISWDSPWGKGRPGWHIECSVMSTKYLGDTLDIHAGGQDLEFPHHENEIAQSEAKTGKTFANYWMHNGFVTLGDDGEKMSKSLGNFILVHDILKELDPQILRFLLATSHYRRPIKFGDKAVEEARINFEKIKHAYSNASYRLNDAVESAEDDQAIVANFTALEAKFVQEMDDDFQADNAMSVIYLYAKEMNLYTERSIVSEAVLKQAMALLANMMAVFGITFEEEGMLDDDIQALIDERTQARLDRNFGRSDDIRDYLKEQGIILDDTPQGTRWRRA